MKEEAIALAKSLRNERYPEAKAYFLAGSIVRGEGTEHSDLDIVVIFDHLQAAYRESFLYCGKPVEAFVHDPATLAYFFHEVDRPSGIPSLAAMISEGIELPAPSGFSARLKRLARSILADGPPAWTPTATDASRYQITGLIDDLRDGRPDAEVMAIGVELYSALANHIFRSRGIWTATGKTIPGRLAEVSSELAVTFESAFSQLLREGKVASVIELTQRELERDGGWLFEGYISVAPEAWRSDGSDA